MRQENQGQQKECELTKPFLYAEGILETIEDTNDAEKTKHTKEAQ